MNIDIRLLWYIVWNMKLQFSDEIREAHIQAITTTTVILYVDRIGLITLPIDQLIPIEDTGQNVLESVHG